MALVLERILADEAKKRQGQRTDLKPVIVENSPQSSIKSREQAGRLVGVSDNSIQRAKTIAKEPDIATQVRSGSKSLNQAYKEARQRKWERQKNQPEAEIKPAITKTTITLVTHQGEVVEYPLPSAKPTAGIVAYSRKHKADSPTPDPSQLPWAQQPAAVKPLFVAGPCDCRRLLIPYSRSG